MNEKDKVRHDNNRKQVASAIADLLGHSANTIKSLQDQLVAVNTLIAEKGKAFREVIYSSANETKK